MTEEIAALAVQHASRDEIGRAAAASGMRSLWDDGIEKVGFRPYVDRRARARALIAARPEAR